ncbi:uncharacterized protein L203_104093 [Cryptococcus depauperatus CBS 7841]|uniref:Cell cycle control protein cwf19 n=1 Tax=Cryptococcus depauperatus CBS 7841 TaxID=1295531 RepID=A0AAJ8JUT6_9TREE
MGKHHSSSFSPRRSDREKHRSSHDTREHNTHHKHGRDHKDRDETEEERKERKRLKKERKSHKSMDEELRVIDDDPSMWIEKSIDGVEATANIPTSDSLPLKSNPSSKNNAPLPKQISASTVSQERESWMLEPVTSSSTLPKPTNDAPRSADLNESIGGYQKQKREDSNGRDFFESLGTEYKSKDPKDDMPDPTNLVIDKRFELNKQLLEGKSVDEYEVKEKRTELGGPGYQWRMMKLKRLYEQAEEQSRPVEEVALERYGSLVDFNEALEERRFLDQKEERRRSRGGRSQNEPISRTSTNKTPDPGRKFMFSNPDSDGKYGANSRPGSRAGFRKPGEDRNDASGGRVEGLRREGSGYGTPNTRPGQSGVQGMKMGTPIPSVFTPTALLRSSSGPLGSSPASASDTVNPTFSKPPLSTADLNKLQAKVLRAKLMDDPNADALEKEYEFERERSERAAGTAGGLWAGNDEGIQGPLGRVDEKGNRVEVQVLPTLDARGRLYDVGTGQNDIPQLPGNRRKNPNKFETRDSQGNLLRYNADDDDQSLGELVRQERFGAGSKDQKNIDAEMARAIATDGGFQDNLDYLDDNVEKIARKKMKTDAMKRAFAINDYARTKKALDTCQFCYQDDRPPQTAIVALGSRTYMCCTQFEELVPGHCLIVPLQHHLSMLEMEDDDWEEVRNFMKCLMRMHAKDNKGVIFFETIISFKHQRHTYIEAIPIPAHVFADLPAYFRESIMSSEGEWTQHKKLIDFSTRPGGFRRMMVPNLPYFMVQWDYKGEKGYGHVIEGVSESGTGGGDEGEGDVAGAGAAENEFPRYFAQEVIGNILGLESRKWRKPRRIDQSLNKERARVLGTLFQPYNWTIGNTA